MRRANKWRVLAIDPMNHGFAFAVLKGHHLLDWGMRRGSTETLFRERASALISRYRPDIIVLERLLGSRRRGAAAHLIETAHDLAAENHIATITVSRAEVRIALSATTKMQIARAIAEQFPELAGKLPRERKPWMNEDARMNVFDALSFALAAISHL